MQAVFKRYTNETGRAFFFAILEAKHRDQSVTLEDILIGLTWEGTTRASEIGKLKQNAAEIRGKLEIPYLPSTTLPYLRPKSNIRVAKEVRKAITYAAAEADLDREYWIDSDHLLRGVLRVPGPAADALKDLGLTLEDVRLASATSRKVISSQVAPRFARLRLLTNRHETLVSILVTSFAALFSAFIYHLLRGRIH